MRKLTLLALILLVLATLVNPAASANAACGKCSFEDCLSIVRLFNTYEDYRWMGDWDPRFDNDYRTHYYGINLSDCDVRCELQFSRQRCPLR